MNKRLGWQARWCIVLGLIGGLGACGGGGSPADKPVTGSEAGNGSGVDSSGSGTSGTDAGTGQAGVNAGSGGSAASGTWFMQRMGVNTNNLYPGNTGTPLAQQASFGLWLDQAPDFTVTLKRTVASASGRGFDTVTLLPGLLPSANNNTTVAMVAGSWSIASWSTYEDSSVPGERNFTLFVHVKGPGFDSGAVRLSTSFSPGEWSARLVMDDTGHARVYWNEDSRKGRNVRLENGVWVTQPDVGTALTAVQQSILDPGGQGWMFFSRSQSGGTGHYVRTFTAADGLGPEVRLDDPAQGASTSRRVAYTEGRNGFTTMSIQTLPGAASSCLAVRRMTVGGLQAPQCIMVSADAVPNEEYVSLSSNEAGHAVLVWSTGQNDRALYVARRDGAGTWSGASKLVDVTPAGSSFSNLSGLKTAISAGGQALVLYRASDNWMSRPTARALVASVDTDWTVPVDLVSSGAANISAALRFNAQGVPGVLQFVTRGSGDASVTMSTWRNGSWQTESLRSGIWLSQYGGALLSTLRLEPQGQTGWLALWDEGNASGTGYRELWAAEYR